MLRLTLAIDEGIFMLGVVFVRRLRDGKTYDDFRDAWYPDSGFGVPARIVSGPA